MKKSYAFFCIALMWVSLSAHAQTSDTSRVEKEKRNVIKLNISSLFIFDKAFLVGYERLIKKNQSFSVQAGHVSLSPGLFRPADSLKFVSSQVTSGYSFTGDYRFYLPKENKDGAPHGIYVGPYAAYLHIYNENSLFANTTSLLLKSQYDVLSIGAQLGYQFVLGKHWTIDLILIGPSLTNYRAKLELLGAIDPSKITPELQKILENIAGRFPFVGSLMQNKVAESNGKIDTWNGGFRYSMHVGFRF